MVRAAKVSVARRERQRRVAPARASCEAVPENMQRKLRAPPLANPFHVCLVDPEIPQNTGNIARLCAATQSRLHLVGRLGFRIDQRAVRRAGIDYWHLVDLSLHPDFGTFALTHERVAPTGRVRIFSAQGARSYLTCDYQPGDALVFGRESTGVPREVVDRFPDEVYGIPTLGAVRSLNLASAAAIVVFEALRKVGALDHPAPESTPSGALAEPDDFVG
jgi:tRNA (cytidine/uridine-2'-O-)-methyltransferase